MKILYLRTEYKVNPIGVDTQIPRLSWVISSEERGVLQTAHQIKCAITPYDLSNNINLIWDSGKIYSDKSVHIEYEGKELKSGDRLFWQVKVWDNKGNESDWSEIAFWEMGLLNENDWKAKWIEPVIQENTKESTPCPYLRKEFSSKGKIKSARAYITCHGLYKLNVNGEKTGNEEFTPGWTSYQKRLQYQVYDVTSQLKTGGNAIGVILGDGWYRGYLGWQGKKNFYGDKTALLFQLNIFYEDGTEEVIISDQNWTSSTGPILKSDIYNGETYDARLEMSGWDLPGFDDSDWKYSIEKDFGFENIVASLGSPVRITETIKPVEKIITPKGELVFDLGQNITGFVQVKLKGERGSRIKLQHAEVLDKQGNFYTENLRAAKAEDTYIFKGEGIENYMPSFTFHGFRYIKIEDNKGEITIDDIRGMVVHSDLTPTGTFECSDDLINRFQNNIQWGMRGNFLDVPTDCPQRDERLGWTGDAQVFASTACFNMDCSSFYSKWLKDFIPDQKSDGSIPWVVPNVIKDGGGTGWSDGYGATGWADAAVIIPWIVYCTYGDKRILEDQYECMKGWEEYMIEASDSYIFKKGFHFGDWLAFAEYYSYNYYAPDYGYPGATTDKELIATAYFYYTTCLMQKIASILGKNEDAERYKSIMPRIKAAFQFEFLTPSGRLISHTQTAYTLALAFDLLPKNMIKIAAKRLADDVNHFGHITTGFLGTPLICKVLTDNSYPEIAYKLLFNKRYPSWLYPVTMGATTIWERWDCIKTDGTFQTEGMNSFNHYAYGAVGNWLYSSVAGINNNPDDPGYKNIIIKPYITDKLTYAKASFHAVYGEIFSGWEIIGRDLFMTLTIPSNTKAFIYFPSQNAENIFEGNQMVKTDHIKGIEEDRIILEIGSGLYQFTIKDFKL